ncbi:MAG: ribosome silencing factor [bacterium]
MAREQSRNIVKKEGTSEEKSLLIARFMQAKKAQNILILDLRQVASFTDYFVICTGRSDRQVQAIAEHLERELKGLKWKPTAVEGLGVARWVLMDFGDVIVHIFQKQIREFYDLEGLWSDAPRLEFPEDTESMDTEVEEDF